MYVAQSSVSCHSTVHWHLYFTYVQNFLWASFPWAWLVFPSFIFQAVVETRELFVMMRSVWSYPSSREQDTHREVSCRAAFRLIYWSGFAEELGIPAQNNHSCGSVQGGDGMEPPEGNSKAVISFVRTALALAGCTRCVCSALPTADNHPDHTNTSGSEALPWVAQGPILKCLDVTGCFSMVLPHRIPLCRETELEHHWEQPGHVVSIPQGCKHPLSWVAGEALCREITSLDLVRPKLSESFTPSQSLFSCSADIFIKFPAI